MGNFRQGGDRGGDRGGFRGGERGGRDFGRPSFDKRGGTSGPMHKATCADCGKSCEVPFVPKDGRPVYCSDCFMKKGGRDGGDRAPQRDFHSNGDRPFQKPAFEAPKFDGDTKRRLESIEYKIDKLVRSMDLLLGAKLPKVAEEKPKDMAKIKEELTAVVKKVSKEAGKEVKAVVKAVKAVKKATKGKK